jgi:putative transposase
MSKQKHHTATFKAQLVLEMLKEDKAVTQIAAEHQIHPGPLHRWKRQALENFPHLSTESQALKQQADAHDQQLTELYAEIGKLTTQVEWLKKIWPRPCQPVSAGPYGIGDPKHSP